MADVTIPSFVVPSDGAEITITIDPTQAYITDQGYTYNQAGLTYNQAGVQYGGINAEDEDIVPQMMLFTETPHIEGLIDIYTPKPAPPPANNNVAPGWFMYINLP